MGHERCERLIRYQVIVGDPAGVDVTELVEQDIHVLRCQVREAKHWPGVVDEASAGESVLSETRLECCIRVEATSGVEQKVGGAAKNEPEPDGGTLKTVVEDP